MVMSLDVETSASIATRAEDNLSLDKKTYDINKMYMESTRHTDYPTMEEPLEMSYCRRCGFPVDFCDFGPQWATCKSFALSDYPQYYSHYLTHQQTPSEEDNAKKSDTTPPPAMVTMKTKKKDSPPNVITIQCVARAKHKMATVISGLDSFDVKLENAAKIFKKRFACGSSVVKGVPGQRDHIEIQGDFESDVENVLQEHFREIPSDSIIHLKHK